MKILRSTFWGLLLLILGGFNFADAQPTLVKDYSYAMEIPSIITMESSPAHIYVLSDTEGMVVFRNKLDSLQWLYSSTGMEQRGYKVTADIRFAYLFGDSRRLTVLEPTSVLGVYSSTLLPVQPADAKRIDQNLYVALGEEGLAQISLETPSAVDSTIGFVEQTQLKGEEVLDLESSTDQLFVLASGNKIIVFNEGENSLKLNREISLNENLNAIFLVDKILYGSDDQGNIFEIDNAGSLSKLGNIGEPARKIQAWKNWLIIRGSSNRLWTSYQNRTPSLWKDDEEAGNYFVISKGQFWLSEYNQISKIAEDEGVSVPTSGNTSSSTSGELALNNIPNQTIPYSKPLLLNLTLKNDTPTETVKFNYQSDIENAKVRGNSFFWKPASNDVGQHRFKIIATTSGGQTDSTTFTVDVRSFNAPPRFAPIRSMTIPMGEEFTLPFSATDPDGMDPRLIRFLGVDLPDGAEIEENTGKFSWIPTPRQVGENKFRVIATDQFGAASSVNVTIEVAESVQRGDD